MMGSNSDDLWAKTESLPWVRWILSVIFTINQVD
jgi:hypothetical protein